MHGGRGSGCGRGRRGNGRLFLGAGVEVDNGTVVGEDVHLGDAELPGKDVEKLSFDSVHVPLAEDSGGEGPVNVP